MARPRKSGERYPSGQLKRPSQSERDADRQAKERAEMSIVLAQPHRREFGMSQMAENALGRFCLRRKLHMALYDAGVAYASTKSKWAAAWGAPMPDHLGGNGGDVSKETQDKRMELILESERVMLRAGGVEGLLAVIWMAYTNQELAQNIKPEIPERCLLELAIHQGRIDRSGR